MRKKMLKKISIFVLFLILSVTVFPIVYTDRAQAANMARTLVRLDRMAASTATTGTVCARPTTNATEASVQVTFPTGFTVSTNTTNWTVNTTNLSWPGTPIPTAWPGIGTATSISGQTVTFPSGDLTVGTTYCFNWTNSAALTTGTAGTNKTGTIITRTSVPAEIDSGSYATTVITSDQIVVTAVVPSLFTFILSGNTDAFTGNLSTTNVVSTSGITVETRTNAANGWVAWVRSANAALNSASTGGTIGTAGSIDGTPSDLNPATGYVLDADVTTQGGGTGTMYIAGEYNGSTNEEGGTLSTAFQQVATADGTTDGDVFTLIERAFISATQTAATDYTDTLTVVAAGMF